MADAKTASYRALIEAASVEERKALAKVLGATDDDAAVLHETMQQLYANPIRRLWAWLVVKWRRET